MGFIVFKYYGINYKISRSDVSKVKKLIFLTKNGH